MCWREKLYSMSVSISFRVARAGIYYQSLPDSLSFLFFCYPLSFYSTYSIHLGTQEKEHQGMSLADFKVHIRLARPLSQGHVRPAAAKGVLTKFYPLQLWQVNFSPLFSKDLWPSLDNLLSLLFLACLNRAACPDQESVVWDFLLTMA